MPKPPRRPIGQRRELLILLPASLLVLVALSTFALLAYRSSIEVLIEERRAEAGLLARRLASELALGPVPDAEELRRRLPTARAVTVVDDLGRRVAGTDPRGLGDDLVSGTARYRKDRRSYTVQIDLPAAVLRSRERALRVLTPVLLVTNGVITVLVLVFLRHFLAPFEGLLQRARAAGREVPETQDEVVFLVETFDQALEALAGRGADEADELKTLQQTLARSLESGVLLCDARGAVLALNDLGAEILAVEPPAPGQPLAVALGRHPELASLLERSLRRGRDVKRRELAIETPAGERVLGLTAHPLRRDDGAVRGFLVLFADLTDARRETAELRLADSLSQLGELTAGVAHELRNSLATLRGCLTLVERAPDEESIADYLSEIRRESDHLERVLEDFLSFARPGSARPQEVDLLALVYRAAADPALGGAAIAVAADPVAADPLVEGDPQLLERAIRNLLMNAVEAQRQGAGPAPSPVRARVRGRGEGVEIRIDDRGPGLTPEAEKKLFDPFFSRRPGGVGMGLALTRRIALLHGGRVEIENRPGGGARAILWIPRGNTDTVRNGRGPTIDR